jgi:hypothetical protein
MDSLTKGEAGELINMSSWQDVILKYFSTTKRENLIGHNNDMENI